MNLSAKDFKLNPYDIHIWYLYVRNEPPAEWFELLSHDEKERALHFQFPIHKNRFIAARANLRLLLSQYEGIAPQEIEFSYNEFGKPFLQNTFLQFNVSHSDELVVYGLTLHHRIGVDIEKIEKKYDAAVAKRFFSPLEYEDLMLLPEALRLENFYKIWARKEALIKATGLGMKLPLASFTVSLEKAIQPISLQHEMWQLHHLQIDDEYQSALATEQEVKEIIVRPIAF